MAWRDSKAVGAARKERPHLWAASLISTVLRWTATMMLRSLEEEASAGFLGGAMACQNVTSRKVGFFLLVGGAEVFHSTHVGFCAIVVLH